MRTWNSASSYFRVRGATETALLQSPTISAKGARYLWHKDTDVSGIDCLIVPGGFSYGDYLRAGAIARFSPIMKSVEAFASSGGLVIGICNGFQILCEAGLLPGVLMRNDHLQFRCQWVNLRVETSCTSFTNMCSKGDVLAVPISHGEGNYFANDETLDSIASNGQVVFRYCDDSGNVTAASNPNGSLRNIAGGDKCRRQRARHDAPS